MFVEFFYKLRDVGVPVSPTSFLTLQRALGQGLVCSIEDFYTTSRCTLVKSERYFDLFDQVFFGKIEQAGLHYLSNAGRQMDSPFQWTKRP